MSNALALFAAAKAANAGEILEAIANGLNHLGDVAFARPHAPGSPFLMAAVELLAGQLDHMTRQPAGLALPEAAAVAHVRRGIVAAVAAARRQPQGRIERTFADVLFHSAASLARIVGVRDRSLAA